MGQSIPLKDNYKNIIVRLLSELYLPDIYRLDIPTTLLKPREENDSIEFTIFQYSLITTNDDFDSADPSSKQDACHI